MLQKNIKLPRFLDREKLMIDLERKTFSTHWYMSWFHLIILILYLIYHQVVQATSVDKVEAREKHL